MSSNRQAKSKKSLLIIVAISVIIPAALLLWIALSKNGTSTSSQQDELVITALPVGKADAFIITKGHKAFMIDTGEELNQDHILEALSRRNISALDFIIVTHFDKDHAGSVKAVTDKISTGCIYIPDYAGSNHAYKGTMNSRPAKNIVSENISLEFEDVYIDIYPAMDSKALINKNEENDDEIDNDLSLVTSLKYNECSFLFTGDIEKLRIKEMLATDTDWSHDWIKIPHHGNYQKAEKKLIEAVSPKYAIITCSEEEPPKNKLLQLLEDYDVKKYATTEGEIITTCDGINISISVQ